MNLGLRATGTQKSMVFGVVVARYIALPLAGIGIVKGLMRLNLVKADPLYEFVLLIQYAVPPAMNMGMSQLYAINVLLKTLYHLDKIFSVFIVGVPIFSCYFF